MSTWQKTGDSVFNFPVNVTDGRHVQRERAIRKAERRGRGDIKYTIWLLQYCSGTSPVVFYSSTLYISSAVSQHQLLHILQIQRQKMFFMWGLFFQMLHRRNWTRETEPFWFKPVKRYKSASVLNNLTTVHYACIQTTELRRIKRMWVENIYVWVSACVSVGRIKQPDAWEELRQSLPLCKLARVSKWHRYVEMSNWENGRGCIRDSCQRPKQAAGRTSRVSCCFLWRLSVLLEGCGGYKAVRTWRRRYFILKTISNTLSAVDEFDPVNLSRRLNKCSCNGALICKISIMLNSIRHKSSD